MDTLCRNLELVLRLLPEDAATGNSDESALHGLTHELISHEDARRTDTGHGSTDVRGLDTASDGSVSDVSAVVTPLFRCFGESIIFTNDSCLPSPD